MNFSEKIFNAGVVGAGGAGFPTHVKAKSNVEFVLANGAECEPLIHKDYEIMLNKSKEIIEGMKHMIKSTNARKGYFGIKEKNALAIEAIESQLNGSNIEMSFLGDFYPSGDEYELVYHATKRLIPPHGLPLDVGCVVNNVETFYNIFNAVNDIPVTDKFVCVTGMVKNPSSFFTPIGTSFKELIEFCGGAATDNYAIFVSGILMGKLTFDTTDVVTKTTAGIIVLPADHYLVMRQQRSKADMNRIGKSACDQCSYCTEFCPRYLLGYDVQPHKVMRTLVFTKSGKELWNQYADLCCSCGLCSLYACPEDLYPREACDQSKYEMRASGIRYEQQKPVKVHPIKEGRRVPLKQLMKKLNIAQYDSKTPFTNKSPDPERVKVYLKQHVGQTAKPVVSINQKVNKGDKIGEVDIKDLGANIHSPVSGIVTHVTDDYVRINAF
ncbi:MAG: 4Fe-4S dicluster domain-containing protein [Melioribacteraceae bacterium]|nr:4Fe-4S dicluster domain-containing protein [Melioribacteraceae bacterium]